MKISALIQEAPVHPKLSLDKDLIQKAMLKYPGYNSQQALTLYMADTMAQQQQTDAVQNNLISKQQSALKSIGQELNDYEAQAQETDREVERLKQLSGTLTTGGAGRQQKAKISADELEKLQKDLELLKSKPGMDSEKFKKLEAQIKELVENPAAEDKDINRLQSLIANIQQKQSIGDEQYNTLEKQLNNTQAELEAKERRFKKSLAKNKTQFEKNATALKNFEQEISATTANIKNDAEEARKVLNIIKQLYNVAKDNVDPDAQAAGELAQATVANAQARAQQQQYAPMDPDLLNQYNGKRVNVQAESVHLSEYDKSPPKIYKDWGDPNFNKWMADHLMILINLFKGRYSNELSRKQPTYGDGQISYDIQEEAWYLKKIFDGDDPILTKEKMDAYLDLVKMTLFSQPVEISQQDDLPLRENLHKTYERMLDNLIGLPYIKG